MLPDGWGERRGATLAGACPAAAETAPALRGLSPDMREACLSVAREHGLSARELEILELYAAGATLRQLCEALFVSRSTVKTHLLHIHRKLGAHTRDEVVALIRAARA